MLSKERLSSVPVHSYGDTDSENKRFLVLSKWNQRIAPSEECHYLLHGKCAVNNEVDVERRVWSGLHDLDPVFQFFSNAPIAMAVSNKTLHKKQEGWTRFAQFDLQTNKLPAVYRSLSPSLTTALGVTRSFPPTAFVIDIKSAVSKMSKTNVMIAEALPASGHSSYMTIAVPVRKREYSCMIARPDGKRC